LSTAVDHDVGGFQITMQNTAFVGGVQSGTDLAREFHRLVAGQAADTAQQRRQIFTIDVLHRQEMQSFDHTEVVHAADVWVRHLPRNTNLIAEARQRRLAIVRRR
jgi:hypothetical protein